KEKFGDGTCNRECMESRCLRDGFDCLKNRVHCRGYTQYCRAYYASNRCDQGCNNADCGWDGSDCFREQSPQWAKGTLLLHTKIPKQNLSLAVTPLLWTLSVFLQSPLKLRGNISLATNLNLFDIYPQKFADMLAHSSPTDSNSLLFLQVDNRPCSRSSTCFPYATEAGSFLHAVIMSKPSTFPILQDPQVALELQVIIGIRGVQEEIGSREEPAWIWAVAAIAVGLLILIPLVVFLVMRKMRLQRSENNGSVRVRHRSKVANDDDSSKSKAWMQHTPHQEQRVRYNREKDKISLRKKKKYKEAEKKRRREPLGEDAIRMPLKRDQEPGSDTDFTQSSMEDINIRCSRQQEVPSICDHRTADQRHAPPRGWERNAMPPPWCGPDGSVVLIRAVRSGLDRVVLELLQAGVPVNNTDHTRSALHWACSVNHLSLARTLIRYGAAVDLQDNKGETALFLSSLHGCYDTSRLLLLHGANLELHDRRGRRPIDVAREAMHHQVLELLLAHQIQRGPVPVNTANDVMWEERALMYSPWVSSQGLPGRSASFSGMIAHRDMTSPPQDWSMGRMQYPPPQNWRPQLNQSATALVPPRVMGRSPRPISTLQEVTSEDEDRDRHHENPRATTPHFLSPQPAPRQRSFSCTQHALQRRSSALQPEPNYLIVTDRTAN
uniref:Notch receptor, like n=1 Tax=Poecilia reticulata TaxID=8081 RepID=A0A3P9N9M7_POERE